MSTTVPTQVKSIAPVPTPVHSAACCFDGDKSIYVFSGRANMFDETDNLYKYDIPANEWKLMQIAEDSPKPKIRCGHTMVLRKGRIYMFGGMMEDEYDNSVWLLEVVSESVCRWEKKESNTPERNFGVCVYDEEKDRMLLHGGMDNDGLSKADMYEYDFEKNKWTPNAFNKKIVWEDEDCGIPELIYPSNAPIQRMEHCGDLSNQNTMIIYGGWVNKHQSQNDVWTFDISKNKWVELEPSGNHPDASLGMVGFTVGDWFLVCGGNQEECLTQVTALDLKKNKWIDVSGQFNIKVANHACCTSFEYEGKRLHFVAGGSAREKTEGTNMISFETKGNAYIFEDTPVTTQNKRKRDSDNEQPESKRPRRRRGFTAKNRID